MSNELIKRIISFAVTALIPCPVAKLTEDFRASINAESTAGQHVAEGTNRAKPVATMAAKPMHNFNIFGTRFTSPCIPRKDKMKIKGVSAKKCLSVKRSKL